MKLISTKILFFSVSLFFINNVLFAQQDFQGKAYYFSKTPMQLGSWGSKMSEEQKKQIAAQLKNRLEKTYILTFNKEESIYKEEEKLDAISGATDSWGKNFSPGDQYKNVKTNTFLQNQEFYGKLFLIKENMTPIKWQIGTESKQIGQYTCFKATSKRTVFESSWWTFSWERARAATQENEPLTEDTEMIDVEAWYTPMIPVSQGPGDYWGLPGLILEVSAGNTTLLCSKIVMNPKEKIKIEALNKGKIVDKKEYNKIITEKMQEFRNNSGGRSR